jgi:hypothetical protein
VFEYRLTLEDIHRFTFLQAVDSLKEIESAETIKQYKNAFERFKKDWEAARDIVLHLAGCPAQQRDRAFESVILTVSDDNPLLVSLLSLNDGGNDAIIAFLNTLTKMQDDLLAKRDGYENPQELLFENDPPKVDLNALLEDCDFQRALLTSWDEKDFENFVLSHATFRDAFHSRSGLTFDIPRIERQVCECFL